LTRALSCTVPRDYDKRKLTDRAVLYVGFRCNADCRFCYYKHLKPEERKWRSLKELKKEVRLFRSVYNNRHIDITGGEPTIYPNIIGLVKYCNSIGILPTVITNGIMTSDIEFLGKLKDSGLNDLLISVQGYKDRMTDITLYQGHHKHIMQTFKNCRKLGIPFRINCVVHKQNYKDLPKIAKLVAKEGASVVNFIVFNPYYEWSAKKDIDFQEKHSVIAPHISKAIDVVEGAGAECNVRYFPFCFLPARQRHTIMNWMQLSYDRNEWDFGSWYRWTAETQLSLLLESGFRNVFSTNKYDALYNTFALRLRRQLYYKPSACYSCFAKNICDGLSRQYYERYGQAELEPIKNMFETKDPLYFKLWRHKNEEKR